MKTGLILNNIGTPSSFERDDVKSYLDQFLMDPDVIDLPWPFRWFLVKGLITPRRSAQSAEKFKAVWTPEGSPLMKHSVDFAREVAQALGDSWVVRLGMRYGRPSIEDAAKELRERGADRVLFAPLYPQFADATTGSAVKELNRALRRLAWNVPVRVLEPFHRREFFLSPQAELIREAMTASTAAPAGAPGSGDAAHVLFSFHGLPEDRVCRRNDCLSDFAGDIPPRNCLPNCYRAQSIQTAFDLARTLGLPRSGWSFSFQSRLGRAKWTGPATDEVLMELGRKGVPRLFVACPSFVADCLETLEEIGMGGAEDFRAAGGGRFHLVPCLNSDPAWSRSFAGHLREIQGIP